MAIVTFWNNNTGKIGQTYSSIAISAYMAVEHNYKILLMSTRYDDEIALTSFGVEDRMKTLNKLTEGKQAMDLESGIEGMSKLVYANRLTPELIPSYTKVVYKDRLEVVVAPKKKPGLDYPKIYKSCKEIINFARQYYDIVFVDLNNGLESDTTKDILKMSNIVILNIEQKLSELEVLKEMKKEKELFNPKQVLALINNYDRKSKYSSKNITRELGEKKEILTVPYANLFSEAVQEGTTADFFLNTRLKRLDDGEDRTTFFIRELKRGTEQIVYKMQELQMRI